VSLAGDSRVAPPAGLSTSAARLSRPRHTLHPMRGSTSPKPPAPACASQQPVGDVCYALAAIQPQPRIGEIGQGGVEDELRGRHGPQKQANR
jgi:hypothetical protein